METEEPKQSEIQKEIKPVGALIDFFLKLKHTFKVKIL